MMQGPKLLAANSHPGYAFRHVIGYKATKHSTVLVEAAYHRDVVVDPSAIRAGDQ